MSKCILIVDDEVEVRSVLAEYLKFKGYLCLEADNGETAYEIAKKTRIDLIISDINMPKMNGFKLLKLTKAIKPNLPVILTTGYDISKREIKSLTDKPEAFVKKPFSLEYIYYLIHAMVNEKK